MAHEISIWEQFVRDLASINRREEITHVKFNSEGTSYDNAEINDDHAACFDCYILEARKLLDRKQKG